ncbi:hypothetical protein [Acidithiobacillus sp.]
MGHSWGSAGQNQALFQRSGGCRCDLMRVVQGGKAGAGLPGGAVDACG